MATPDVGIVGGGIFGLAIAWVLVRRGVRVEVVERRHIGAGASGGLVGALAPHVPERWSPLKAFQLEALAMAGPFWASVAEASGLDPGFARTGRLIPLADQAAVVRAAARAREACRLWPAPWGWEVVDRPDPWDLPSPTGRWVRETLSARIHPRKALAALAAALRAAGVVIREGESQPAAPLVVEATGWEGLAEIATAFGRRWAPGVKGQAALLALPVGERPQLSVAGRYVVPHADGTVAVGSTSERSFTDPARPDAALDAVLDEVRAAVPELARAPVVGRWAGVRPRGPDGRPVLGPHPLRPGRFIATGGFRIGFALAPKVAEAMAALMLDGRADAIPAPFRSERLVPAAGG